MKKFMVILLGLMSWQAIAMFDVATSFLGIAKPEPQQAPKQAVQLQQKIEPIVLPSTGEPINVNLNLNLNIEPHMIQNAANNANSQSESNAQATATAQAESYTEVVMKKVGEQIDQLNGRIANNVNLNNAPKKSTEEALTVDYSSEELSSDDGFYTLSFSDSSESSSDESFDLDIPARPTLFLNQAILRDQEKGLSEYVDTQKRIILWSKNQNNGGSYDNDGLNKLHEAQKKLDEKVKLVTTKIAKRVNACAVQESCNMHYVDPRHDVTQRVINKLNKAYSIEKEACILIVSPNEKLYNAILIDDVKEAEQAIQAGADVNYDINGKPLIFWVVSNKSTESTKLLIEHGAVIDKSLVQLALDKQDIKSAVLIARKCRLDLNSDEYYQSHLKNRTLLDFAVTHNDFESVLFLMQNGVPCTGSTRAGHMGKTIMEAAVLWGSGNKQAQIAVIQELINRGYNLEDAWSFEHGSIYRDLAIFKLFITNGANPNHVSACAWTPMLGVIAHSDKPIEMIQILLDAGASINQVSNIKDYGFNSAGDLFTPIKFAHKSNKNSVVKFLAEHGARFEDDNNSMQASKDKRIDEFNPCDRLYKGILNDSAEEIKQSIQAGANINQVKDGKPLIVLAILLKKSNAVKALLEYDINVNTVYLGKKILHHAMNLGDIQSSILLLKKGADFVGSLEENKNIMDAAIESNALELVQELINRGWDIHNSIESYESYSKGKHLTNIWWNIIKHEGSKKELLSLFLNNGLNPNQVICHAGKKKGASWTPLLLAIERHNLTAIKMLLEAGADINKKACPHYFKVEQHSPLSYAITVKNPAIIDFLIQRGAQ